MTFIILMGFVYLFVLAFLQINPDARKADIETKAEYVITVTWPKDLKSDVDTWVEDPAGNVIYFRQPQLGLTHLDRDDTGHQNDSVLVNGQWIVYPYNQEITTIRGFIRGEWVLNIHMYNIRDPDAVPVTVKIDKLNPTVKTILTKTIMLKELWDEVTVARFVMTSDGDIIEWVDIPKKLTEANSVGAVFPAGGNSSE